MMSDLCAEARAALFAASEACEHAEMALIRARHYLWEAEDLAGRTAVGDNCERVSQRLFDVQCDAMGIHEILDKEAFAWI